MSGRAAGKGSLGRTAGLAAIVGFSDGSSKRSVAIRQIYGTATSAPAGTWNGRREMARFVGIAENPGVEPTDTGERHPWWKFVARSEERLRKSHERDWASLRALLLQTETRATEAK